MNVTVKFSVSRASPAGPAILAELGSGVFKQTVTLTPDKARDLYRDLGNALLALDRPPGLVVENRSPGSLEGAA